ncbi:hypothetical protein COU36_00855, partial [Candidatus Micrarchaeota archaeon CG10_big_fil_rev_8_21_14_0_10_59_7]
MNGKASTRRDTGKGTNRLLNAGGSARTASTGGEWSSLFSPAWLSDSCFAENARYCFFFLFFQSQYPTA